MRPVPSEPVLIPRKYQEEIFNRARRENVIAVLATGSGKTFISTLLIKHVSTAQSNAKIVFLVPKVNLVKQQGDFLSRSTALRIRQLHGEVDLADGQSWRKLLGEGDCFVMTAQIFYNLLSHSHWMFSEIALVVFDECHNARGNHPYMKVMREYWALKQRQHRPRIFGMTASPVTNAKDWNIEEMLKKLERSLDCKIIGVLDNVRELNTHSPKPIEVMKEYAALEESHGNDYPLPPLRSYLGALDLTETLDNLWSSVVARYEHTLQNVGIHCAELYLFDEMNCRTTTASMAIMNLTGNSSSSSPDSEVVRDIVASYRLLWNDFADVPLDVNWLSPKLRALIDVISENHTPALQAIVFVQQRQVAYCLARVMNMIPALQDKVKCDALTGGNESSFSLSTDWKQVIDSFRRKELNLLFATSVAEEGLDFPSCDLVIRFDELTSIDAYIQSRGRARNPSSAFVLMLQSGDVTTRDRYLRFQRLEPELRQAFQDRHPTLPPSNAGLEDFDIDDATELDVEQRERFVTPAGAVLSYDNAIEHINYLCALTKNDAYTNPTPPRYAITGCFRASIALPRSLPLDIAANYFYQGPYRQSKKEAKRAVAFIAAKRLYELDVFDDHLLPVSKMAEEEEAHAPRSVNSLKESKGPHEVSITVPYPFVVDKPNALWLHEFLIDGAPSAAFITGTACPPVDLWVEGASLELRPGTPYALTGDQLAMLQDFNKHCIWLFNTRKQITADLAVLLAPILLDTRPPQVDFQAVIALLAQPEGSYDWTSIDRRHCGKLLVGNTRQRGRHYILHSILHDVPANSCPTPGTREHGYKSFVEHYEQRWAWKSGAPAKPIPAEGPMVALVDIEQRKDGRYQIDFVAGRQTAPNGRTIPLSICRWLHVSAEVRSAFGHFAPLCHRVSAVYRVRRGRFSLGLPSIREDLLVESLMIPDAQAGFSNQRLETLGDGVLQLLNTVHLYNRYTNRHEGQLTDLRQQSVANKTLRRLAKVAGLPAFIVFEQHRVNRWPFTQIRPDSSVEWTTKRQKIAQYPRRSLQDCTEALLGSSYLSGGVAAALVCGSAFGLNFGGPSPWQSRGYPRGSTATPAAAVFHDLEAELGYEFRNGALLVEAVTHPSFPLSNAEATEDDFEGSFSYQRLEFLGDAVIDLAVMEYVFDKFPEGNSDALTRARQRIISASALAYIAVRYLSLHKLLLSNSTDLTNASIQYVALAECVDPPEIVTNGWKYTPPKPLSDVVESIFAAVLVDSGWDYDRTREVVLHVMNPLLQELNTGILTDPVSRLMVWAAKAGCTQVKIRKFSQSASSDGPPSRNKANQTPCSFVSVHGLAITEPIEGHSRSIARGLAAEEGLRILRDEEKLSTLCECERKKS